MVAWWTKNAAGREASEPDRHDRGVCCAREREELVEYFRLRLPEPQMCDRGITLRAASYAWSRAALCLRYWLNWTRGRRSWTVLRCGEAFMAGLARAEATPEQKAQSEQQARSVAESRLRGERGRRGAGVYHFRIWRANRW